MAQFDFTQGVLPAGVTLTRAAGPWSRTKRVEYTDFDFTASVLPAGVTVQRAAGPWSRRGESGALVTGTAANVARFDYDPPVENRIPYSKTNQSFAIEQSGATISATEIANYTRFQVSAVAAGQVADANYTDVSGNLASSVFSIDIYGASGGEIVYIYAVQQGGGGAIPFKRLVLTTNPQRVDLYSTGKAVFVIGNVNVGGFPSEAVPAQTWFVGRRQLNRGPVALAYAETTGTPIYVPPVCKGLMLEPERTNLVWPSASLVGANWGQSGGIITLDTAIAPDGSMTADTLNLNSGGVAFNGPSIAPTANLSFTSSVYARNPSPAVFRVGGAQGGSTDYYGPNVTAKDAWGRFSFSLTNGNSSGNGRQFFELARPSPDAGTEFMVWGSQLESSAVASSYIPTTTGAATRPVESLAFDVTRGGATGSLLLTYSDASTENRNAPIANGILILAASSTPRVAANARAIGLPSGVLETGDAANVPLFDYNSDGSFKGLQAQPANGSRKADAITLDWSAQGVRDGAKNIVYKFGDGSMQLVEQQVASGFTTVPVASLNSYAIRAISILETPLARMVTLRDTAPRRVDLLS